MDAMPSPKKESNGDEQPKDVDLIDPDDPEYQREVMRPPDVKEDVKMMDQRQRVNKILNSDAFRSELEDLIDAQLLSGGSQTPGLMALRQLSDLIGTKSTFRGMAQGPGVVPVNDIRGVDVGLYSRNERLLRCKLAALYRLVDINGWSHGIFNHISLCTGLENEQPSFLINPFGLLYSEVTAASLVKIDAQGSVLDPGNTSLGVNRAGWNLHSALHAARPDLKCLIHVHTPNIVAISASKHGLLVGLSQEAMQLYPISYHDYHGFVMDQAERESLAKDIGSISRVLFLRNHGMVIGGASVEEAYHLLFNAMSATDSQVRLGINVDLDNVTLAGEEEIKSVVEYTSKSVTDSFVVGSEGQVARGYQVGELEFEAMMRQLDNAGFRTGYPYRNNFLRNQNGPDRRHDVEVPPASTSSSILYADDEERARITAAQRLMVERTRSNQRTEWLNSPNTYHREEVQEIGTSQPRTFTRWVADKDGENKHSGQATPVRSANQFAPQGENPKEFKEQQKRIRGKYFQDMRSAGPQSKLLDGVTEEEARKLVEEGRAKMSGDRTVIVGAASMGIIQKEHREKAVVYHSVYTPNPFDKVTDEELSNYHSMIQKQSEPCAEPDTEPESEATAVGNTDLEVTDSAVEEMTLPVEKAVAVHAQTADGADTDDASELPLDMQVSIDLTSSRSKSLEDEPTASVSEPSPPAAVEPRGSALSDTLRSEASGAGDATSQDESRASLSKDEKKKKTKKGMRLLSFSKKKEKK